MRDGWGKKGSAHVGKVCVCVCACAQPLSLSAYTLAAGWDTSISRRMALPSLVRTMPVEERRMDERGRFFCFPRAWALPIPF